MYDPLGTVLAKLERVKKLGGEQYEARCPAHPDKDPSLGISTGDDGRVLLLCRGPCETEQVLAALGMEYRDLWPERPRYQIKAPNGEVMALHERYPKGQGKGFRWLQPNGKNGLNGHASAELPLYGVHRLAALDPATLVVVCEGEKAAQALIDVGIAAVGTVTGASGTPARASLEPLEDFAQVVLWPDCDRAGIDHMTRVASQFHMTVYWFAWGEQDGDDAADYLERYGPDGLLEKLADAPSWGPPPEHSNGYSPLEIVCLADVQPEDIEWLWKGRYARGKLTVIMGDPGLGKSLITHWSSSVVTKGADWPDEGKAQQGSVLLFTAEDGLADTVRPRLDAAGADVSRVYAIQGVKVEGEDERSRMFKLSLDLELLEAAIVKYQALYVVFDPISAYLGDKVDSYKESDVRALLGPLSKMAERTRAVIVILVHLNKGSSINALYRAGGSIAFTAHARVVLGVAPDPNDEERRLLLPIKMNIAAAGAGLGYRIKAASMRANAPPVLAWDDEPVTITASDALDHSGSALDKGMKDDVKVALRQHLPPGERKTARSCWAAIKEATGCQSGAIVTAAKRELGVRSVKEGFDGAWYWMIPAKPLDVLQTQDSAKALTNQSWNLPESSPSLESSKIPDAPQDSSQDSKNLPKIPEDSEDSKLHARAREEVSDETVQPLPESLASDGVQTEQVEAGRAREPVQELRERVPRPTSRRCADCDQPTEHPHVTRCPACIERRRVQFDREYPM